MTLPGPEPTLRPNLGGRSLTLQLLLFAVLPLIVLLVVIAFGSLILHSQAMRQLVAEREARAGHAAADAIAEQLRQRGLLIQDLAALAASSPDAETALRSSAHLLPDFEGGLAIVTGDGRSLARTPGPDWPSTLDLVSLLDRSRASGMPEFSDAFALPAFEMPVVAVGFASGDRSAVGAFRPGSLAGRILDDAFPAEAEARVWLIDSNLLTLYRRTETPAQLDVTDHPGLDAARQGNDQVVFLDLAGVEYVVALDPVPPLGWVLILEEPWESVDNPLLRQTQAAPLVLIPALLLALLALAFSIRQVVQPLRALEKKSAQVGRGDFRALEDSVGGISEIKSLQRTMGQMADRLQAYQQSVRRYAGAVTRGQEEERRRVARELHDDTIQALIALDQRTQLAQMAVLHDTGDAEGHLSELRRMTQAMLKGVRRIIGALRPIYLEDLGLPSALQLLTEDAGAAAGLRVAFSSIGEPRRLTPDQEIAVYRIAQEALANVARHARARYARVEISFETDRFVLEVDDDGAGFTVPDPQTEPAPAPSYGLMGMQERAELIRARLTIASSPGSGTHLRLEIPL